MLSLVSFTGNGSVQNWFLIFIAGSGATRGNIRRLDHDRGISKIGRRHVSQKYPTPKNSGYTIMS